MMARLVLTNASYGGFSSPCRLPSHASLPSTEMSPGAWGLYNGCVCGGICKSCNPLLADGWACRRGPAFWWMGGGVEGFGKRLLDCSMGLTGQLSEIWSREWQ